jgi:hypothetical protein
MYKNVEEFMKKTEPKFKLEKYEDEILFLGKRGFSYPQITAYLKEFYEVEVTVPNLVFELMREAEKAQSIYSAQLEIFATEKIAFEAKNAAKIKKVTERILEEFEKKEVTKKEESESIFEEDDDIFLEAEEQEKKFSKKEISKLLATEIKPEEYIRIMEKVDSSLRARKLNQIK